MSASQFGIPVRAAIRDIDTRITPLEGQGIWQSYTGTMYTAMSTTPVVMAGSTLQHAEYCVMGNTCFFNVEMTAAAASTGGVGISLPLPAFERWQCCGSSVLIGAAVPADTGSAGTDMCGVAYMASSLNQLVLTSYTNAFLNIASGQVWRAEGRYRTA